jgi:integrase
MKETLTKREKEALLDQPYPKYATELRNLIYLQLSLKHGLSSEKLIQLRWPQVDFQNGNIFINDGTKDRIMNLPEPLNTLFNEWKERQFGEWQKRSDKGDLFNERVFTELDGAPIDKKYVSKMVRMYAESAGIDKKVDSGHLHQSFEKGLA